PRIETYGVTALEGLTEANQDRPFADLVTPLIPAAQRLAYGMLQNTHDCEDAVQEATFKAWRAFPRLREGSNLRAWFLTIVANECRQRRRNRWWSILTPGTTPIEDSTPSASDFETRSATRRLCPLPCSLRQTEQHDAPTHAEWRCSHSCWPCCWCSCWSPHGSRCARKARICRR